MKTTIKADSSTATVIVVRFDTHHSGYHDDAGRFTVKADLVAPGYWLDDVPVPEGFCSKVAKAVERIINKDAHRSFYALDVERVDFSHGEPVKIGDLLQWIATAAAEGKTHIVPFERRLGIPYSNETVAIVRVDHGQAVAEVINAGEWLSPSGTACELFEEALVAAAMGPLSLPDSASDDQVGTGMTVSWMAQRLAHDGMPERHRLTDEEADAITLVLLDHKAGEARSSAIGWASRRVFNGSYAQAAGLVESVYQRVFEPDQQPIPLVDLQWSHEAKAAARAKAWIDLPF